MGKVFELKYGKIIIVLALHKLRFRIHLKKHYLRTWRLRINLWYQGTENEKDLTIVVQQ